MDKSVFVNRLYQAALAAGLSDAAARVTASQGGLESKYGESDLAKEANNLFGIKAGKDWTGPTVVRPTKEVINGKTVTVNQRFRSYATPEDGIADRMKYMDDHFPGFSTAGTKADALGALRTGKYGPHGNDGSYYTADQAKYESTVNKIDQTFLGGSPVPPADIPEAASSGDLSITDLTKGGKVGDQTIPANTSTKLRSGEITGIVFHHTGPGSLTSALNAGTQHKGATYYIDTDGKIYQYAPDDVVRVGIRDPGDKYRTDVGGPTAGLTNDDTISVEVVAPDSDHFTEAQKASAAALAGQLSTKYNIDPSMIVGHGDLQGGANGNKMPTEGVQLAAYARDQLAANPAVAAIADATSGTAAPMPDMVRTSTGRMIATGTYPANDGDHKVLVTNDGRGNAIVKKVLNVGEIPGVIDPMHEDPHTIAGAYIQRFMQQAKEQAGAQAADTVNAVTGGAGDAASQAVQNVTSAPPIQQAFADPQGTVASIASNIGNFLTFGGALLPKGGDQPTTKAPFIMEPRQNMLSPDVRDGKEQTLRERERRAPFVMEPLQNMLSPDVRDGKEQSSTPTKNRAGSPDDRDLLSVLKDRAERASGGPSLEERDSVPTYRQIQEIGPTAVEQKPKTTFKTVEMEVDNPAYLKYIAGQNADPIGQGAGSFADLQALTDPTTSAPPPPKITIKKQVPVTHSSGSPQRSGPTTFAPTVQIASGKMANVGARGYAQGGKFEYSVMPDGSIQETNSGRTTAPAPYHQQHSSNPSATYWDRSSGSWV